MRCVSVHEVAGVPSINIIDCLCQRAANGGSDPSWLNLALFWGAPIFRPEAPKALTNRYRSIQNSAPLPTLQSETWLVRTKVREPHLNPQVRMNFLPLALVLKRKARKVHTNRGVQMWFANFRVNQPRFRLECRERY